MGMGIATVKDYIMWDNVPPFECNCMREPTEEQAQEIINDLEVCTEYGTCRKMMKLNNEWENIIRNTNYQTFDYITPDGSVKDAEGVTMLAMLFCSNGGIITAIDSGQGKFVGYLEEPDIEDTQAVLEFMWYFFRNKGLSEIAVAGILGNVHAECKFNLKQAAELNSSRFGLFQWSANREEGRRMAFDIWVEKEQLDINKISTQCMYAYIEMTNGGMYEIILDAKDNKPAITCSYDEFIVADTPEKAAVIFATSFERCCKGNYRDEKNIVHYRDIQDRSGRETAAKEIYDMMHEIGAESE